MKDIINILGSEWTVICTRPNEVYTDLYESDGVCDASCRAIALRKFDNEDLWKPNAIANFTEYSKKVRRHEAIHAFMHEAGLTDYAHDELLVEFLAVNWYKIHDVIRQIERLEGKCDE